MAESKHIDYQFATTTDSYLLMIDQPKLESIIQNLLSNALKFTSNSGRVHFSLDIIEDQKFIIEVSDSGAGISDADRSHIFERFYQGSQTTTQTSGTGIGLNLTREYCERMNGSIDFESEVGKGSRFWIELPLLKVADQIPVPKYVQLPEPDKKPLLTNTADTSLPCVLVVDDHVDTVEFIRLNLSQAYRVLVAMNGKEGLNLLSKQKVDLVLSDVMMPEMDGLSLCQQIKAKPQWSSIPVVLLTAMSDDSDQVKGLRAGADAYLTKPFSIHVLKARIDNLLQRNRNVDRYIKKQLIVENQEVTVDSHSERLLQETIQFIHKNITDTEINIDKMCKEIGLSHSNLYRKIKQQTGLSLNELIRQVKMKRAAQMIKAKNRTIAEVMYETGFTNHSYFAKCFKKEFGVSPREYAETDRPQS
jgi:DNA-binding response OmpR family regulator